MYQTIIIVGNVGRDPEMRYTPGGQAVTSFSVATNRQYTNNNGETVKETIWFRVSAWGKTGEVCNQYLKKGSKVLVEGRLTADPATGGPRVWTAQDGSTRASFEVSAATVRFLSSRSDTAEPGTGGASPSEEGLAPSGDDGDIPF
jgi:single-strand DNA-binding protein